MALTEIVVCNMALSRIGVGYQIPAGDGTIAGSTDTSQEKRACALWYERKRNSTLEWFPWTFARKYAALTLNDDGTGEIWADEWDNAYTYPSDCAVARRFVSDTGWGSYETGWWGDAWRTMFPVDSSWRFVVRLHGTTKVILTNVSTSDANLEYTKLVTDATLFTEQFADALAWGLASEVAIPLGIDLDRAVQAKQMYYMTLRSAAASVANEEQPYPEGDGSFVLSRGV